MTVFDRYLEQAKDFARKLVRAETGTRRWATVTAVDPVRITYDGTTVQGIIPPVVLGVPVNVGDRVRAHTIHDKTYITRANPTPLTLDDLWVPGHPWRTAAGTAIVPISAADTTGTRAITLPAGRFTVAPRITVTPFTHNPHTVIGLSVDQPTAAGFIIAARRTGGWDLSVSWQAVQMTPTSAEG